jgi:glycosyltransferase involved in cell wall biosynthesis
MNKSLIISILMPVKNTALFLNECLDSIVNQNELNFELIAIDDH